MQRSARGAASACYAERMRREEFRLLLPTTLAFSAFGAGACAPSNPMSDATPPEGGADARTDALADAGADVAADVPSDGLTCQAACEAMFSIPSSSCVAGTLGDGAAQCVPAPDAGSAFCGPAPLVMTSTGSCCCELAI